MIYLACPYSSPDPEVRRYRFERANKAACDLMREGVHVFSPVSHCHPLALEGGLPLDWDFWEKYDREMLSHCDEVRVLMLEGWGESKGIRAELEIAEELGMRITYQKGE